MQAQLLQKLSVITPEEQKILRGESVEMRTYGAKRENIVDAHALLGTEKQIDIRPHTRFAPFPRHKHDFVEIMYVCSGSITHVVGEKAICVKAGELLLLGRNTWHEIQPAKETDIGVNFIIRPAFLHTAFNMMDSQNVISEYLINCLAGEGSAEEYLYFSVADILPVQNLVENLVFALCERQPNVKMSEITMGLLLLHLLQEIGNVEISGDAPRGLALRALQYIEEHYADATLRYFAAQNNLAEYAVSRMIKAQLGTSFRVLLMEKRFAVAQQMLQTTPLSVTDIITAVGYENTSYFYRSFAKCHGCTPQQFRKLQGYNKN
ncbi:MAG: AraC family transcriptional regulator [Oscillospiraceae bacterium]|nr:AraC family transcriptional regulator [Oscillospiraceae bacterium]